MSETFQRLPTFSQ